MSTIIVPTDFSPASHHAIRRATGLALLQGATLHIMHAADTEDGKAATQANHATVEKIISDVATAWSRASATPLPSLSFGYEVVRARSVETAMRVAMAELQPTTIVMATHGGPLLGESLAQKLAATAPCHVLVVHSNDDGDWPMQPARIVVGVDFGAPARRALEFAKSLHRGSITALHVVSDPRLADAALRRLTELAEGLADDVFVRVASTAGDGLVEFTRDECVELVVVAGRELSPFERLRLGSVAGRLIRRSPIPVWSARFGHSPGVCEAVA